MMDPLKDMRFVTEHSKVGVDMPRMTTPYNLMEQVCEEHIPTLAHKAMFP